MSSAFIPTAYPTEPGEYLVLYGFTSELCSDLWYFNGADWTRSDDGEPCDPWQANAVGFKRVPQTVEELLDNACKVAFAEMCVAMYSLHYAERIPAMEHADKFIHGERSAVWLAEAKELTERMSTTKDTAHD